MPGTDADVEVRSAAELDRERGDPEVEGHAEDAMRGIVGDLTELWHAGGQRHGQPDAAGGGAQLAAA